MAKPTNTTLDTANEILFDSSLRHQVGIRRFSAGESKEAIRLLEQSNRELSERLRKRLQRFEGGPADFTTKRFRELDNDIRALRREVIRTENKRIQNQLLELATMEQDFERRMINAALPIDLDFASANSATLRAVVVTQPFSGGANSARTLKAWYRGLEAADQKRIMEAIQLGIIQGETIDEMIRRVESSSVLGITRHQMEAVVRTAVNHVSNAAREAFWDANEDIIDFLRWNATLDGRTSAICAGRDGALARVNKDAVLPSGAILLSPQAARPPAHPSCRSVMTAVLNSNGVADIMPDRPFVRGTGTRAGRERDFRKEARTQAGESDWKKLSIKERNVLVKETKREWAAGAIGTVPGTTNYDTWLRGQNTSFQNEVLGPGRARAFRKGLRMDKFVDRRGNELTLTELRSTQPEFF